MLGSGSRLGLGLVRVRVRVRVRVSFVEWATCLLAGRGSCIAVCRTRAEHGSCAFKASAQNLLLDKVV